MGIECSRLASESHDAAHEPAVVVSDRPVRAEPAEPGRSERMGGLLGGLPRKLVSASSTPPAATALRLLAGTRIGSSIVRRQLRAAVVRMLCDLDGADTVYFGKTTRRHAEDLFAFAERTARQAEAVDPSLGSIPLEERMAVVLFTRRIHIAANQALASGRPLKEHEALYVRLLDAGLDKLPSGPDVPVFRGMNVPDPAAVFAVGSIVTEPRFWCVSGDRRVAFEPEGFGGNVLISFVGPVSAKPLGALATAPSHREWIFPRNRRFEVLACDARRDDDGRLRYHVTLKALGPA